jgi:uncharacterized protein (TIGR02996 family)
MSERTAFLRAIAADPADNTTRLVYADWLDEHDERDRAEYIRVQVKMDAIKGGEVFHGLPVARRLDALATREEKLAAAHPEWFKCMCIRCVGSGGRYLNGYRYGGPYYGGTCGTCGGSGNLFSKGQVWFDRGFPVVEVRLADLGSGTGHGFAITSWLAAVVLACPAVRLVVRDREPLQGGMLGTGELYGALNWYANRGQDVEPDGGNPNWLPWSLASLLSEGEALGPHRSEVERWEWFYDSPGAADGALSRAAGRFARGERLSPSTNRVSP